MSYLSSLFLRSRFVVPPFQVYLKFTPCSVLHKSTIEVTTEIEQGDIFIFLLEYLCI